MYAIESLFTRRSIKNTVRIRNNAWKTKQA